MKFAPPLFLSPLQTTWAGGVRHTDAFPTRCSHLLGIFLALQWTSALSSTTNIKLFLSFPCVANVITGKEVEAERKKRRVLTLVQPSGLYESNYTPPHWQ